MLERVSALAGDASIVREGVRIAEAPDFKLTQVTGDHRALKTTFPKLPVEVGTAVEHAGRTMLRIGPEQLWIIGTAPEVSDSLSLVPLSSSRTRIAIEGTRAREVLSKGAAIDFHPKTFTAGTFVMSGIHHMPVLIHCIESGMFHLYIMRTFALAMWEWLVDAAE